MSDQKIEIQGRTECGPCIEALNLQKGLQVELVQTETHRQVLLFVHKSQTIEDPENHQLIIRAPLRFIPVRHPSYDYENRKYPESLRGPEARAHLIGSENLTELFYGRSTSCNYDGCQIHGQQFQNVQKFIGAGFSTYFQKASDNSMVKLAEIKDKDHIRITPYMAHSLHSMGFYALKVTYPVETENGQEKGWYETLRQEDLEQRIACEPEIEVILAP